MIRKLLWSVVAVVLLLAATAFCLVAMNFNENFHKFKERLNHLHGVEIGQPMEEILYSIGTPDVADNGVVGPKNKSYSPKLNYPEGGHVEEFPIWNYWTTKGNLFSVRFDDISKKVVRISCIAFDDNNPRAQCTTIGEIRTGLAENLLGQSTRYYGSEEYIVGKLGEPDHVAYNGEGEIHRKFMTYDALGLQFTMIDQQLLAINQTNAKLTFLWWLKHRDL